MPAEADEDQLRVHQTLGQDYAIPPGTWPRHQELALRNRILGSTHSTTLETRGDIASWTGESGRYAEALHMAQALLPDLLHVLGLTTSAR